MQSLVSCTVTGNHRPRRPGTMYLLPFFILSLLPVEWPGGWGGAGGSREWEGRWAPITGHLHSMGWGGGALISLDKKDLKKGKGELIIPSH